MDAGRELHYRHDAAGIVDAQRSRAAFVDPTCGVQAAFWFAPTTVAAKLYRDFACGGRAPLDQGCIGLNSCLGTNIETGGHFLVIGVESHEISFQCPKCGHDLKRTIGRLKANEHMTCPGCGIGINIDTDRLARATEEIQNALDKIPPEITIKFFR